MTDKHRILSVSPADAGCWIEGSWGQYAAARMIEIAAALGYVDPATSFPFAQPGIVDIARRHLASMGPGDSPDISDDEHEQLSWTCDDVEAWMNDNIAPEGFSFGWYDGEFFFGSDASWEDAS